jgi:hypothetical protein
MIDYHIDVTRRLLITRGTGSVSLAEVAVHLTQLLRDPKFHPDFNALIVGSELGGISATAAATLAPLVRAWSKRSSGVKWAFVLPSQTARAAAESALDHLQLTALTTRCFLSEAAALAWLEVPVLPATVH